MFQLSKSSMLRLGNVHSDLIRVVVRALAISTIDFGVIQGVRTIEQQRALYAQGRTAPGKIVTWTLNSKHLPQRDGYGHAIDVGVYVAGVYVNGDTDAEIELYKKLSGFFMQAAADLGLTITWGGTFKGKPDWGHYSLGIE